MSEPNEVNANPFKTLWSPIPSFQIIDVLAMKAVRSLLPPVSTAPPVASPPPAI